MRWLRREDLEDLALGAAVLGTGGGGDPYLGRLMAERAMLQSGPVRVIDVDELQDDAFVCSVSMMGAPTVMMEKVPGGEECLQGLRILERHLGQQAVALIPGECGGLNSTLPIVVAAQTGLPIVDADGMGRAFPELQQDTFNMLGVPDSPCVLVNERGDHCIVTASNNNDVEWIARGITMRYGGVAHKAGHPMTGRDAKRTAVRGSFTFAWDIGAALRQARATKADPFAALAAITATSMFGRARVLFHGKMVEVDRRTEGGFNRGELRLDGLEEDRGANMRIFFQNENLMAERDGRTVAMVPDLITVFDAETAIPVTTEAVRYGARVRVVGIPTPDIMRRPEGLKLWGPRAFGYAMDYVPLEELLGVSRT